MASGRSIQLTRQIGIHLTIAKLGRLGYIVTPCLKNKSGHDLNIIDKMGNSKPAQVRVINGGSWQFNISKFLDVVIIDDIQYFNGERKLEDPGLICIYVLLLKQEKNDFFVFSLRDLQVICSQKTKVSRYRPKNPSSLHAAVRPSEIRQFKDNWVLIEKSLKSYSQSHMFFSSD